MTARPPALRAAAMALALSTAGAAVARAGGPATVDLVVPRYLVVDGAPGLVAAQVRDADGAPVSDGVSVTFTAALGLTLEPRVVATRQGVAVTTAHPGRESGFALVTARAGDARGDVIVWVRPGPAARLTGLVARPAVVVLGATAAVTATAEDAFGHPVEGDAAAWSIAGGRLLVADGRFTAGAAGAVVAPDPGAVRLVVTVAAGAARGTVVVPVERPAPVARVYLPAARAARGRR